MKCIVFFLMLTTWFQMNSQVDTLINFYDNGNVKKVLPRLDGMAHGKSIMWYKNGQVWSKGVWKKGKQIKTIMYHENGKRSYFVHYKKWKLMNKTWYPNGQLWTKSKSKYFRSTKKEFDSTGVLVQKVVQKKGSNISCIMSIDSELTESTNYQDGSCTCSWGEVNLRNGLWIDGKGRDVVSNYSYVITEYDLSGYKKKETIRDSKTKKHIVREWDKNGTLILETKM